MLYSLQTHYLLKDNALEVYNAYECIYEKQKQTTQRGLQFCNFQQAPLAPCHGIFLYIKN